MFFFYGPSASRRRKNNCLSLLVTIYWLVGKFGEGNTYLQECTFGFYCDGEDDPLLRSSCQAGYCQCSGRFVQRNCLPKMSSCVMEHGPTTTNHPVSVCTEISSTQICSQDFRTYHCHSNKSSPYEVHVLGTYQATSPCSDTPEISRITVVKQGHLTNKVVLVLASTCPVTWYLNMKNDVEINQVVLVQKTESLASVVWPKGNVKQIIKVSNISVQQNSLYGKGSDTIKLLQYVENVYGSLTSFTGKFEVKQWRINIGEQGAVDPSTSTQSYPSTSHFISSSRTQISSSINFEATKSSPTEQLILPSNLLMFHAFGTLEFKHITALKYSVSGSLEIRSPLITVNTPSPTKMLDKITSAGIDSSIFPTPTSSFLVTKSSAIRPPPSSCKDKPCSQNALCNDTFIGFSCVCKAGFTGNGFQCDDIDECYSSQPCPTNSRCDNIAGSYNCTCLQPGNCRATRILGFDNHKGLVSVLYDGEWGTICRIGWGFADTRVACRDAGYPYAAGYTSAFGFGKIWLANVQCQGNESKLANCTHPGWGNVDQTCTHNLDVGVECVPTTIRLAGSDKPDEGRIEIYHSNEWGTICDKEWDKYDADIACKEMGFEGALRALRGNEVVDGTGRIWLERIRCTGVIERFLKQCNNNGWNNVTCNHSRDAGVKCRPKVSCDFELNTCSWRNEKKKDNFDWQLNRAETPTLNTGPTVDHTKKTKSGVYMYIETTRQRPGDKAWLVSPVLEPKGNYCLKFYYYMVGSDVRQLNVFIRETGRNYTTRLWNVAGARKVQWLEGRVPLRFNRSSEVVFEAVSGNDQKSDIAIDDILLDQSNCTIYPTDAVPDADECESDPCDVNAKCVNIIGSYRCNCNKGYTGNGTFCTDFNECITNPCHINATCNNTIGGFTCKCNPNTDGICDDAYRPCGLRNIFNQLDRRIIGGTSAAKGSWPWAVAILNSDRPGTVWCGGALINNEWVLTAAHCFDASRDTRKYTVILGEHDVLNLESEEQRFSINLILIIPQYIKRQKPFDIAMIRLHMPANYTTHVLPICMARTAFPVGTQCVIAGWGTRTFGAKDYPQFLQEAVVPIIDRNLCQTYYTNLHDISFDMVCAGYITGTIDACQGDSGGPLMCKRGNKWYLAGLTSFGYQCASQGYPGVYANVQALHTWVEYQVQINQ